MPDIAELIADEFTGHSVDLLKVDAGIRQDVLRMLGDVEADIVAKLAKVDPTGVSETFRARRLRALEKQTRETIRSGFKQIRNKTGRDFRAIARSEEALTRGVIDGAISSTAGVSVSVMSVVTPRETLTALANDTLVGGAPSRQWWGRQSAQLRTRFMDTMRSGVVQGEALGQLVQRVRGTRALNFTDGVMQASRRQAETLVRSSVQAVANAARTEALAANSDVIKSLLWVATLDRRTTLICSVRDRKEYNLTTHRPIGHGIPWREGPGRIHWACRSTSIPRVKSFQQLAQDQALRTGGRPTNLQTKLLRAADKANLGQNAKGAMLQRTRASMGGQVPAKQTFPQWLKKMDTAKPGFGAGVLGKTKWDLWNSGKLTFEQLVNQDGMPMTVRALMRKAGAAGSTPPAAASAAAEAPFSVFDDRPVNQLEPWVDQKSAAKVEQYFMARHPGVRLDTKGMNGGLANQTFKELDELFQRFPSAGERIKYIGTYRDAEKLYASGTWPRGFGVPKHRGMLGHMAQEGDRMAFNPAWYGKPSEMATSADWAALVRFHDGMRDLRATATHEFGHALDRTLRARDPATLEIMKHFARTHLGHKRFSGYGQKTFKDRLGDNSWRWDASNFDDQPHALRAHAETWAESFAVQRYGDDAAKRFVYARDQRQLIDELFDPRNLNPDGTLSTTSDFYLNRQTRLKWYNKLGKKPELTPDELAILPKELTKKEADALWNAKYKWVPGEGRKKGKWVPWVPRE